MILEIVDFLGSSFRAIRVVNVCENLK